MQNFTGRDFDKFSISLCVALNTSYMLVYTVQPAWYFLKENLLRLSPFVLLELSSYTKCEAQLYGQLSHIR